MLDDPPIGVSSSATRAVASLLAVAVLGTAAPAAATPNPDGRYSGRLVDEDGTATTTKVSFRVSKDGRRITRLSTTSVALCIGATFMDNRIAVLTVFIPRIAVRRDGRFEGTSKPTDGTEFGYKGRRRGRKVTGELDISIVNCSSTDKFRAKRVGR